MKFSARQCSRVETMVSVTVLLCLAAAALGVFFKQFSFNPAVLVATSTGLAGNSAPPATPTASFAALLPSELAEFGAPENFNADTLSDKIDGKADLYLTSGFASLHCQRFALKDSADEWMEWFVYDMGNVPQAFAVFSGQRRSEAQPLELTKFAYRAKNAVYFVCGRNYIEGVAATPNDRLLAAVLAMARNFVAANLPGDMHLPELDLFPKDGLLPDSHVLQIHTAFGFDQFRNVFTAKYKTGDGEVLAFATVLASPDAANSLRDAYHNFLLANSGKEVAGDPVPRGAKTVGMFDGTEIVFSRGNVLAGVHAAPNIEAAKKVAAELKKGIVAEEPR